MELPNAVSETRSEAQRLGNIASDYAAASYTIPDQLKKTVQEALDYNKDVIGIRSKALADYQASPATANAKFGVQQFSAGPQAGQQNQDFIFNPFERNSAIQQFIGNQGIPFNTANALLGMREGTVADTVRAGTGAFNAQATATQAAAEAARQTYQDVLNEFVTTTQLNQEQQKIDKSGSAGSDLEKTMAMLAKLLGGGGFGGEVMGPPGPPQEDITAAYDYSPGEAVANLPRTTPAGYNPFASQVSGASATMAPVKEKALPSANIKVGTLNKNIQSKVPLNL